MSHHLIRRSSATPAWLTFTFSFLLLLPSALDAVTPVAAASHDLPNQIRQVPAGGGLVISQLDLVEGSAPSMLELTRFEVFRPDARIVVHEEGGERLLPRPRNVYLRGSVAGLAGSTAVLSLREDGSLSGLVTAGSRTWLLGGGADSGGLVTREVDLETDLARSEGFSCGTDALPTSPEALADLLGGNVPPRSFPAVSSGSAPAGPSSIQGAAFTATAAIETDFEYFQRFGNTTAATNYAGDLVAYASTVYSAQVATDMVIGHLSLWTTSSDPWTQTNTQCGFYELGRYWNNNRTAVDRTFTHMLSGKSSLSGIAWVGVLCNGPFNWNHGGSCPGLTPQSSNYGGDYGFSSGISGSFNINNPNVVWDIVAFTHEVGHNFNSPHSHCYGNLGGNPNPVDRCFNGECGNSGCHCGTQSLPCATAGAGCGTIMSYCHLLGGGLSNISMNFGIGHPNGTAPERIAARMSAHVISRAAANPGCLDLIVTSILDDGFESGNTSSWTQAIEE